MACDVVTTGRGFLSHTLDHFDCQAQSIGSYGFGRLSEAGSAAATLVTVLLTLFVAVFAYRLLVGRDMDRGDLVGGILKVGIVLTLAFSWPAVRPLVYDTVLFGPAEIAATLATPDLPDTRAGFDERLQRVDNGLASFAVLGPGRQVGALQSPAADESFRAIALADDTGLGFGRTVYLAATIGSLAVLRIAGGLLLALTPLFAGLLLFDASRGLFSGWLRGLVLVALGSVGVSLLLAVQMAVMEPWLLDVLNRRRAGYAVPSAPTELLALTLAFAVAAFVLLALLARVAFQQGWGQSRGRAATAERPASVPTTPVITTPFVAARHGDLMPSTRALAIRESVAATLRREDARVPALVAAGGGSIASRADRANGTAAPTQGSFTARAETTGPSRAARRTSRSGDRRDGRP